MEKEINEICKQIDRPIRYDGMTLNWWKEMGKCRNLILRLSIVSLYSSSKADVDPDLGGVANTFLNEKNP